MHGSIEEIQIAGLSCMLYLPDGYGVHDICYPVVYINGEAPVKEILAELKKADVPAKFLLLAIKPQNWNDDFTPWKSPAFRKGEEAPKGNADLYIEKLAGKIKPYMDGHFRTKQKDCILLGYSLGGLTALYTLYKTDLFTKIGTVSGSLWYDGFTELIERRPLEKENLHIYLSLGKKETQSRNPRMGRVAECTDRIQVMLKKSLGEEQVLFEWNDGGHFHEIPKRFAKALQWLLRI